MLITKKTKNNLLTIGFALILVGATLIFQFFKHFMYTFQEPVSIENMTTAELAEGALVEDDIFAVLDYYMYEETTRKKYGIELSSHISTYYYIVPVLTKDSEELYMTMELTAAKEDIIRSICNDTIAYLSGEMSEEDFGYNTYHVTGPVRNMTDEEIRYMIEWFQSTEYFGTKDASEIRSYIHPVIIENYHPDSIRTGFIISVIMTLAGFICLLIVGVSSTKRVKSSESRTTYTPKTTYSPYQTGFIPTAAPEDPLNENQQNGFLNQQNKGYLNQQNNGYLNQQNNQYLNQQNNQTINQPVNTTPNPPTNVVTAPSTDLHKAPEFSALQNNTPSQPANEKHKKSSGLSDIFFKVDHK